MTDERAKEIADELRKARPGAPRGRILESELAQFAAKLYDDVEKLKQQQGFPTFGDAA